MGLVGLLCSSEQMRRMGWRRQGEDTWEGDAGGKDVCQGAVGHWAGLTQVATMPAVTAPPAS